MHCLAFPRPFREIVIYLELLILTPHLPRNSAVVFNRLVRPSSVHADKMRSSARSRQFAAYLASDLVGEPFNQSIYHQIE